MIGGGLHSSQLAQWAALDAHVHLHREQDAPEVFDVAHRNLIANSKPLSKARSVMPVLMLAEMHGRQCFERLARAGSAGPWRLTPSSDEAVSLRAEREQGTALIVIAGRQIVTSERIEVLALACRSTIPDGLTLDETLRVARERDALIVLPWGFGKWIGRRGALIKAAFEQASPRTLFLGDNAGRPVVSPTPALFRVAAGKNVPLVSGTDPLPLAGEHRRVGSQGTLVRAAVSSAHPARDLKSALRSPDTIVESIGRGARLYSFVRNQLALRIHPLPAVQP